VTLALAKATGLFGTGLEFRLVIEGCIYEFCTDGLVMRGGCVESGQTGKRRVGGLVREGLGFEEHAYLAGAQLEQTLGSFTITDTPYPDLDAATEVFSDNASTLAWLTASLTASGTTLTVNDTTDLAAGGYYHLGTEVIYVESVDDSTTCTIQRGLWRTTGQAHNVTAGAAASVVPVRDAIGIWTGRRWWLYAHGADELASLGTASTGTLFCQGRISSEPELSDETTWTIAAESRWAFLEQEVGANFDRARKIRGIYYPETYPHFLNIARSADNTFSGADDGGVIVVIPSGFYATNHEWVAQVVATLNANTTISSTWGVVFSGEVASNGRWELWLQTPASARYFRIIGGNAVDGTYTGYLGVRRVDSTGAVLGENGNDALPVHSVDASTPYLCMWRAIPDDAYAGHRPVPEEYLRLVPRTCSISSHTRSHYMDTSVAPNTNPPGRLYLDDVSGLTARSGASSPGDTLLITQPDDEEGNEQPPRAVEIFAIDTAEGYVDAYGAGESGVPAREATPELVAAGPSCPEILAVRTYGDDENGIDLHEFRDALVDAAPGGANDGSTPWVLDDDLADWTDAVTQASAGRGYLTRRRYVFHKGARLSDVLRQDAILRGLFFYTDADFKIALRPLTIDTAAISSGRHIEGGSHITDQRHGSIRKASDGIVNVVEISTGYDPIEDKHVGRSIRVIDVGSIAETKLRRVLEVRPKSAPAGADDITDTDALTLSAPIRAMFGSRIFHVEVDVPWTFLDVLLGDSVLLTSDVLPWAGKRGIHDAGEGMQSVRGIVVGRSWYADDAAGTLTLLVSGLDVAGYAPSARVSSATNVSGNTWDLVVEANRYAPSGAQDASYFSANFAIRLIEWDADTPTVRTGTVSSVTLGTNTIRVALDSAWGGLGGAIYNLAFGASSSWVGAQQIYMAIAASTRRANLGGTSRLARVFAP
jgi:hypothetical protein